MASIKNYKKARTNNANKVNLEEKPKNQIKFTRREEFEERLIDWITFYRRNLHRFAEHYILRGGSIKLHLYQIILIYLMNLSPLIVIVACRAAAKSFVIALYACCRCILYPNSKIVIASATKKQASLIVSEKIQKELMPNSYNLRMEIKDIKVGANSTEVIFKNGSSIVVVPANDNARGFRATCMIYEEFRMIKKDVIDTVLSPFLIVRPVPYLSESKYEHLQEEPMEIYISSAFFRNHWMWDMIKLAIKEMYQKNEALFIGFDYAITMKHNIRTRKQMLKEKKKLDNTTFAMEYQNLMIGEGENSFFPFDLLNRVQLIKKAFYPRKSLDILDGKKNKYDIPKQKGEIRILAIDIAMIVRKGNDNTVITCIRALPNGDYYERQVCYIEAFNGGNTTEQAVRIKELFYDFNADYVILDTQNAGVSIADELGKISYSEERDVEYPSWICFNDSNLAERIKNKEALPVLYSIKGTPELNQRIHFLVKDLFEKKRIKLLINSTESKDYLESKKFKDYSKASPEERAFFDKPYIQTDLLINEMVNLSYEINKSTNKLRLYEPKNGTKDRYMALGYGCYLIDELEQNLNKEENNNDILDYCFF